MGERKRVREGRKEEGKEESMAEGMEGGWQQRMEGVK